MLARNKPAKPIAFHGVRDLTREDIALLVEPRAKIPVALRFRDSHHRIARMFASGLRVQEVHARSGYSYARIQTLAGDPAFQELVASYRDKVTQAFIEGTEEFFETLTSNMLKSERMIGDKIDEAIENGETLPIRDLIAIGRDAADRAGYGKKETRTNINIDMGKDLEAAIRRSASARGLTIEHFRPLEPDRSSLPPQQLDRRAEPLTTPSPQEARPVLLKRRA